MSAQAYATILIVTKDRREEVLRAVETALRQAGDHEVLVIDDGSTDGTAEAVTDRFPSVRLERSERPRGVLEQRNRGAELASAGVIVSVDDDVVFESPRTVQQTVADFDDPRVGAVAVPFVDVRNGEALLQRAPTDDGIWVTSGFIGAACALRREAFRRTGGYRLSLGQYWEESDLALRMLDRGWVTRLGRADRVLHIESIRRNQPKKLMLARRNAIIAACMAVPAASLPAHLAWLSANAAVGAAVDGPAGTVLRGTLAGYRDSFRLRAERQPVARRVFRLRQRLWRKGPKPLESIESELPRSWL